MFIDEFKDWGVRPSVEREFPWRRRLMRLTLYQFDADEIRRADSWLHDRAGYDARGGSARMDMLYTLEDAFTTAYVRTWPAEDWVRAKDGRAWIPVSLPEVLNEDFFPAWPYERAETYERRRNNYEKVASVLVEAGWLEQLAALRAGVPVAYVFPESVWQN